jgi:hypothetical protein
MRSYILIGLAACTLSACVQPPQDNYVASKKSALELRSIQTRTVAADSDAAMRGVIATMHDLGYRITRVSPEAGTVSGARQATLRMAVVVQPKGEDQSAVRANASIISPLLETQVDSAEFYQRNFFEPLGATMGRTPEVLKADDAAPDAARPVAELNTAKQREAAAKAAAAPKQE